MSDRLLSGFTGCRKLDGPPCSGNCTGSSPLGSFPLAFAERPVDGLSSCSSGVALLDGVNFLDGVAFLGGVTFLDGVTFPGGVDCSGSERDPEATRCLGGVCGFNGERGSVSVRCSLEVRCAGIVSELVGGS